MNKSDNSIYSIPAKFRRMENLHIVFWLFKDLSWCMNFRILGMIMVIPTISVAIFIAIRTRKIKAELTHNLAIIFWITANSYWMVAEFYGFDEKTVWNGIEGRHVAMIPFSIGVLILAYYYILIRPKELRDSEVVTM